MKARVLAVIITLVLTVAAYGATFAVTNTNDDGPGSLRQAIVDANAGGGTITFAIVSSSKTIVVASELPRAETNVVIDGTTQPGYNGQPIVEIQGAAGISRHSRSRPPSTCQRPAS